MLKAKMSDTRHASEKMVRMLGQALPAMAEKEARAILAETEKEGPDATVWHVVGNPRHGQRGAAALAPCSAFAALAESLAAFVA